MVNRFVFGHEQLIYIIMQFFSKTKRKVALIFVLHLPSYYHIYVVNSHDISSAYKSAYTIVQLLFIIVVKETKEYTRKTDSV